MKKYIIVFAALLAAFSCKVENPLVSGGDAVPGGGTLLTFTAEIETTRTVLGSDWSVTWAEGDEVSILWKGGRAVAPAVIADGKVTFSAAVDEAEGYFALYPATLSASVGDDGRLVFTLPSQQNGSFSDCAAIASYSTREALDFGRFRSAVGLIRFNIGDSGISRVSFSSAGDVPVSGSVSVSPAFDRFDIAPDAGPIEVAVHGQGRYFMAVLPGLSLPGLDFRLGTPNAWKGSASSSTPAVIGADDVLCINTPLDENMVSEGEVVVDDVETLKALLSGSAEDIDGKILRVGPGTYKLGLALDYATPVSFAITGAEGTVFTGDDACLTVNSAKVNLILDGITFSGCTHNGEGGALCLKAGNHTVKNCTFTDNQTTSSTADRCGGAVYVGGTASADISGCVFTGNSYAVTGGGALAVFTTGLVTVLDCKFSGNGNKGVGNGGAILQKKAGNKTYIAHCSFEGNACNTNGPDIFTSAADAMLIYNCTFINPDHPDKESQNRGSIRINAPLLLANCSFAMEVGTTAGAACNNGSVAFGQGTDNVIVNNLILSDNGYSMGTGTSYTGSTKRSVTSYGHNVYHQAPNITLTDEGGATDLTGIRLSDVLASIKLSGAGVLEWDGPAASLGGFQPVSAHAMETIIGAYARGGSDFLAWLKDKGIFNTDAAGNVRDDAAWWPGSYQGQ